jgi:hypothetical protein
MTVFFYIFILGGKNQHHLDSKLKILQTWLRKRESKPGRSATRYPSFELDADCELSRCWVLEDPFLEADIFYGLYTIQ